MAESDGEAIGFACYQRGATVQVAISAKSNIDSVFDAFGRFLKGCGYPATLVDHMVDAATNVGKSEVSK